MRSNGEALSDLEKRKTTEKINKAWLNPVGLFSTCLVRAKYHR